MQQSAWRMSPTGDGLPAMPGLTSSRQWIFYENKNGAKPPFKPINKEILSHE
jgi:hypothetical protein